MTPESAATQTVLMVSDLVYGRSSAPYGILASLYGIHLTVVVLVAVAVAVGVGVVVVAVVVVGGAVRAVRV